MKGFFVAAGLVGSTIASLGHGHHGHAEFHHKREASPAEEQCGCSTYVTTYYHEYTTTTWGPAPTSEAPAPVYTEAATPPTEDKPEAKDDYEEEDNYEPPTEGGSTPITTNGNQWAMTYTPYRQDGQCKSPEEVKTDIQNIKNMGFTTIRTYSTNCDGLVNIGAAASQFEIKMILGVFIDAGGIDGARPQVNDIVSWGQMNLVSMVVVGNEALFNKYVSADALASFIGEVRVSLTAVGYTGPITTTETLNIWQQDNVKAALCPVIDVTGANIQPFFNTGVSASDAGDFVASQLEILSAICPGKEAFNLECGWPSQGNGNGLAIPGASEQKAAIEGILAKAGQHSVIFSYDDDHWKDDGAFGIEKYFGTSKLFDISITV